jgi:hypothetical protein
MLTNAFTIDSVPGCSVAIVPHERVAASLSAIWLSFNRTLFSAGRMQFDAAGRRRVSDEPHVRVLTASHGLFQESAARWRSNGNRQKMPR